MTIEQANHELKLARVRREKINTEIRALNDFLHGKGMDVHSILERRNKKIYRLHLKGKKYSELAPQFGISATSISDICSRITRQLRKKKSR